MCCNNKNKANMCRCGHGKPERFLEPCLLLLLFEKPTHGYDLIERLEAFGFDSETQDTGAIYRALRKLEKENMVISRWQAGEMGPAKRLYEVTDEGIIHLEEWGQSIKITKSRLEKYLKRYTSISKNNEG